MSQVSASLRLIEWREKIIKRNSQPTRPSEIGPIVGVARSYDELHDVLRKRISALRVICNALDSVINLPSGRSGKIFCPCQVNVMGACCSATTSRLWASFR